MTTNQKTAYSFEPITGHIIQTILVDPDPRVDDYWLYPAYSTPVAPPATGKNEIACFDQANKQWKIVPCWFDINLYSTKTGLPYSINSDIQGKSFNGVGPLPDWLTDQTMPSEDYIWTQNKWTFDQDRANARKLRVILNQQSQKLEKADKITIGLRDAFIAQLLSDTDTLRYKAWAAYKYELTRLSMQADFPNAVVWPDEPENIDPYIFPMEIPLINA